MLNSKAMEAGLARFAAELPDLQRGFASAGDGIYASAVDRGMLYSGGTVKRVTDAIRGEYKLRAARLWLMLHDLLPPSAGSDSGDSAQLHGLIAKGIDASSEDLRAQYERVGKLMGAAVPMPSLDEMRSEALAQVNAEVDAEMVRLSMVAAAQAPAARLAAPAVRDGLTIFLGSSSAAKSQQRRSLRRSRDRG